jgi:non-ribosomal peptide synthetase component F
LREEEAARPFDLATPPLVRFVAIQLPGGHCHLLATFPRFLLDEESVFALICEWLEALEGVVPATSEAAEETVPAVTPTVTEWWRQFLAAAPSPARLRPEPRPGGGTGNRHHEILLDRETSRGIKKFAQRLGLSAGDVFFGAWGLLLGRLAGQRRVLTLTPTRLLDGLACGYFDNLLPADLTLHGGQSVEAFLKALAREASERGQQAFLPLEQSLAAAVPPLTPTDFPAAFFWLPPPLNDRIHDTYPRWINCDVQLHRPALRPLTLEGRDGNRISLRLEFDDAALAPPDAEKILRRVVALVDEFLAAPTRRLSELRVLTPAETEAARTAESGPARAEDPGLCEVMDQKIRAFPEGIAAEGPGGSTLTFGELDAHAASLAAWLRSENIADGWNIAICLNPTVWLPVALLGILRAGDTLVPLDPTAEPEWLTQRLDGYDVELIVCDSESSRHFRGSTRKLLIIDQQWETVSAVPATAPASAPTSRAAFVLPGTPQVPPPTLSAVPAPLAARAVAVCVEILGLAPGSRLPVVAPIGTGAHLETLLAGFAAGATLVLTEDTAIPATATHLRLTAGQWRVWSAAHRSAGLPEALEAVCVDQADFPAPLLDAWRVLAGDRVRVIFAASPAGLAGCALTCQLPDNAVGLRPLGRPGPGLRARLSDLEGQPLADGYPGTLELANDGHPDKKISLPAWRSADGTFYRPSIHPPDDETVLSAVPGIADVVCHRPETGGPAQVWVVLTSGTELPAALSEHLAAHGLAKPEFILPVPTFPLDSAGAISLAALPRPAQPSTAKPAPRPAAAPAREWNPLELLHETADAPTVFLIHDLDGDPARYRALGGLLAKEWTVFATRARGVHQPHACHTSVESEAAALIEAICLRDPAGPYHLVGYGYGGVLAFEIARQLRVARRNVPFLVLAGAPPPELEQARTGWLQSLTRAFRKPSREALDHPADTPVESAHRQALLAYRARPLEGPGGLILAGDQDEVTEEAWLNCLPEVFVERMSCPWRDMLGEPSVKRLAVILRDCLAPDDE